MPGMQNKTIRRNIRNKIEDWLSTIDNEELVKDIKRDVIVTGGSIASMLIGDKINDYDIYFRTKDTTTKVADYYVKKFNKLNPQLCNTPTVMHENLVNLKGEPEERVVIFVSSDGIAKEDNYVDPDSVDTEEEAEEAQERTDDETKERYRPVFLSQNAITLSNKLQIVIRFYGEPEKIHSNYDYVHAMCHYDYYNDKLETPIEALRSMQSMTLKYKGSLYPICSLFRMRKFIKRGWKISAGEILKICIQIADKNMDLTNKAILREQLTGVDAAYFHQLISAIETKDGEEIDGSYIASVVDRIFNDE